MSASIVEPHDKMRARDITKVAKGEQAPRPPQHTPGVSRPPPPSSTTTKEEAEANHRQKKENASNQMQRCYHNYYDYHKCIEENGAEAPECKKIADRYKLICPEWIGQWRIE